MQIKNELDLKVGWFDVSAKGYYMQGLTLGVGGQGGVANATNNYSGCTAPYSYNICGISSQTPPFALGENGSSSQALGTVGTSTTGSFVVSGGLKVYKTNLVMGDPGSVSMVSKGGDGASSGSKGGNGADADPACNHAGSNGSLGENGGVGGNAGGGGRGGGAMVIKVHSILFTNPVNQAFYFYANGQNGETGGTGGNAGLGGHGGIGGAACCTASPTIGLPGGDGGEGFSGTIGAGGGSGGGGGKCGSIWVAYEVSNKPAKDVPKYAKVDGGEAGWGGFGGFGYSNLSCPSTTISLSVDPCGVTTCSGSTPPGSTCNDIWICDHKRAMCMLSNVTYGRTWPPGSATPTRVDFCSGNPNLVCDHTVNTDFIGYYDIGSRKLIDVELIPATPTCSTANYLYYTLLQDAWVNPISMCEGMMEGISGLIQTYDLSFIDHNFITTTGCIANPVINFNTSNSMLAYNYDETNKYLIDVQTPNHPQCNIAGCDDDILLNIPTGGGVVVPRGMSGGMGYKNNGGITSYADVPNGVFINPSADFVSEEDIPIWKKEPMGILDHSNNLTFEIFPNPAKDLLFLNINSTAKGKCIIKFYDMLGKKVLQYDFSLQVGLNEKTIDVHSLLLGNYIVELNEGERNYYTKISIR